MDFLSLSCPRPSEFVLRSKKIDDEKLFCRRGNVEVVEQFFGILESSIHIEQLRLHILKIRPEDRKILKKNLRRDCNYQVKSIIFNQSIDPRLVVKFSLKCPNLEYLLVRGYNQKYPCDKTDYLIKVPTHNCYFSLPEIIESQVPLMCKPFQWSHEKREKRLMKTIPKRLFNDKFMVNTEFFFNEPVQGTEMTFPAQPHRNCPFLTISGSNHGVFYEMTYCNSRPENNSFRLSFTESIRAIYNSRDEKEKLRNRSLLLKSDEEWDVDPNQKSIMDMPVEIVEKILENASFKDKFKLGSTCCRLNSFLESSRFSFSEVTLGGTFVIAETSGENIRINSEEKSHSFAKMLFRLGKIKTLEIQMSKTQFNLLGEETQHYERMRIEEIKYSTFPIGLIYPMTTFLTDKCLGSLKLIELGCSGRDQVIYETSLFQTLRKFKTVGIKSTYYKASCKMLDTFVEKWALGDSRVGSTLRIVHRSNSSRLYEFREKYKDRIISEHRNAIYSSIGIRTDNPEKHIVIQFSPTRKYAEIVPSKDLDIENYMIQGIAEYKHSNMIRY